MDEDDGAIIQDYYKKELKDKLEVFNEKIKKIFEELTMKREESKVLNGKINSINEELIYYENQLNLKTSTQKFDENNSLTEETVEKQSNYDDHLLVYNTLKNRLKEISKSLLEVDNIPDKKMVYNDEPIQFQCVCVLFVPDMMSPNDISYQTFRITHETKVYNIIESGLALWDQSEKEDAAKLFFYESEDSWKSVSRNDNVNNLIKNNKSTIKRAKFLLSINNYKPHNDEHNSNQEKNQNKALAINKDQIDKKFFDYTKNFVGLAHYVQEKYAKIKDKENRLEKDDKKPISYYYMFFFGLQVLFLILFLVFLIISNQKMSNPTKTQVEIALMKKQLTKEISPNDLIERISSSLDPFFLLQSSNLLLPPFKMINMARFSFYKTTDENGKNPLYDNFNIQNILNSFQLTGDMSFVVTNSTSFTEQFDKKSYETFLKDVVFSSFSTPNRQVGKTKIEGKYGVYDGQNSLDLFIGMNYITKDVLTSIMKTMNDNFIQQTKALVINFAVQNSHSQKYYYVSMVFEFSSTIGYSPPLVNIDSFYPNLNEINSGGKLIYVTDIFRLLFSIYLLLFSFYKVYSVYCQYTENDISLDQLVEKTLTLETVCDLGIFIVEVMAFAAKMHYLYLNMEDAQSLQTVPFGQDGQEFLVLPYKEYYPIMVNYQYAMMLEGFLMLFVLLRFLVYTAYYVRIKKFFSFIRSAFLKAFPYFLVILVFVLVFAIYAHNLWGERIESFASYSGAFFFVLDFSIGLFQDIFIDIKNDYEVIFIFLFVGIVIFFLQSSLFGVYLESYRLNALKRGNLYKIRAAKKLEEMNKSVDKETEIEVV